MKTIMFVVCCLAVVLAASPCLPILADSGGNVGEVLTNDGISAEWDDVCGFGDTIDNYYNWNENWNSWDPYPGWFEEEGYPAYGYDDQYADSSELSLIQAHGGMNNDDSYISFGTRGDLYATNVKLGYSSESGDQNIWFFTIVCELLTDTNNAYLDWGTNVLKGTHMMLGFESNATVLTYDLRELADRFMPDGSYSKQNIQNAFVSTYVSRDNPAHYDNIIRILAENSSVADNDYLDSYVAETTVDSTYLVITVGPAP